MTCEGEVLVKVIGHFFAKVNGHAGRMKANVPGPTAAALLLRGAEGSAAR